jgi:two-component system nitrogen regulation sensor histidine kinase NtrY
MLNRSTLILALSAFLLIALSRMWLQPFSAVQQLPIWASILSNHIESQENRIEKIWSKNDWWLNEPIDSIAKKCSNGEFDSEYFAPYTLHLFQNDSLVFWTKQPYLSNYQEEIHSNNIDLQNKFIKIDIAGNEHRKIIAFLPIFPKNIELIEKGLKIDSIPTLYPIKNKEKVTIAYLSSNYTYLAPSINLLGSILLALLGYILLAILIHRLSVWILENKNPILGAAFFLVSIFSIRVLSLYFNASNLWEAHPVFDRISFNNQPFLSQSLGDFLLNSVLLLWVMSFFYRYFKISPYQHLSTAVKYILTTLYYLSMSVGTLMVAGVFKSLVLKTGLVFDFDNIFNLDRYSILAILGVSFFLLSFFLFSHRIMLSILQSGLNSIERLIPLAIALGVTVPIIGYLDLNLPLILLLLVSFIYIEMLDYFSDSSITTMAWIVVWLIAFSLFTSLLLYKYNTDKEWENRRIIAEKIVAPRDLKVEAYLHECYQKLESDQSLLSLLNAPVLFRTNLVELKENINNILNIKQPNGLIDLTPFAYNATNQSNVIDQKLSLEGLKSILSKYDTLSNGLYLGRNAEGKLNYWLSIPSKNIWLQAFYNEDILQKANQYPLDVTLFYDRKPIYQSNLNQDINLPNELPNINNFKEIIQNNKSDLYYLYHDNHTLVKISKAYGGLIKPISLFSYLFSFLVILAIIMLIFNAIFGIWPEGYEWILPQKSSLRNRIQLSVIVLIIISFLAIGLVTVIYFKNSSSQYQNERLEKIVSAFQLHLESTLKAVNRDSFPSKIGNSLNALGGIYNNQWSFYDAKGNTVLNSDNSLTCKMDGFAFFKMSQQQYQRWSQKENQGETAIYTAIKSPTISANNGYVRIPYFEKEGRIQSDVSDFIGALLNVYVFLLLIAVPIAIAVANSITNPLAVIGEKLKEFKLGSTHEPLEWKSRDELGDLILEYNKMIEQVEESAKMLAESEREGAWRDMARQVAHEIKNPLTPMKLNIQYLLHAFQSDPENIAPLLQRVSKTMIEQIDSLSLIASEFSNFANISRAEPIVFSINEMSKSVHDLFKDNSEHKFNLFQMTDDSLDVFADKNQVMRVLTNLVKNAMQSIPPERSGEVGMCIYKKDNKAIVKISDNGVGIPDDLKDKIFKPYFTTKGAGTGLGLVISKNIIEAANGTIYFETEANKGTDFYVELPLIDSHEEVEQ